MYTIEKLENCLNGLIKEFACMIEALDVEYVDENNKSERRVDTRFFAIEFVYTKKQKTFSPVSMLYSRVYFTKRDYRYAHIPDFIDYVDSSDISCYYFPYIESEERMRACFKELEDFYLRNFDKINDIALENEKKIQINVKKAEEIKRITNLDFEDIDEFYYDFYEKIVILTRFTENGPYLEFLKGNYEKALKKYQKIKKNNICTGYDLKIIKLLENRKKDDKFVPIKPECASIFEGGKFNGSKAEGISLLKGAAICEIIFFFIYYLLYLIADIIVSEENLIYGAKIPWWCIAIFAGLPALFGAMNFRVPLGKITRREKKENIEVYDEFFYGKKISLFIKGIWFAIFVCIIFLIVSLSISSARFYDTYATFPNDEGIAYLYAQRYEYSEIDTVYYIEGRYNDYGDYIDRPSYVIKFKDGFIVDMDDWFSVSETEENILGIIKQYYGQIIKVKCDRDIE